GPAKVRVELGELRALARPLRHPHRLALLHLAAREPGEPSAVVREAVAVPTELAVADDVDAGLRLLSEDVDDRVMQERRDVVRIDVAPVADAAGHLAQLGRPLEPAAMGRENTPYAPLHAASAAPAE